LKRGINQGHKVRITEDVLDEPKGKRTKVVNKKWERKRKNDIGGVPLHSSEHKGISPSREFAESK